MEQTHMPILETSSSSIVVYFAACLMAVNAGILATSPEATSGLAIWTGLSLSAACTIGAMLGGFLSVMLAVEESVTTPKQVAWRFFVSAITAVLFTPAILELVLFHFPGWIPAATSHIVIAVSATVALASVSTVHRIQKAMPSLTDKFFNWLLARFR
jgi:hypothetical protein